VHPALRVARWNLRTGVTESYRYVSGPAVSVSLDGDVIDFEGHVVRNGQTYYLRPPEGGAGLAEAVSISADGRTIIGHVGSVPVVWHC